MFLPFPKTRALVFVKILNALKFVVANWQNKEKLRGYGYLSKAKKLKCSNFLGVK